MELHSALLSFSLSSSICTHNEHIVPPLKSLSHRHTMLSDLFFMFMHTSTNLLPPSAYSLNLHVAMSVCECVLWVGLTLRRKLEGWRWESKDSSWVISSFQKEKKRKTGTRWTTEALLKNKMVVFLRRAELRKTLMRLLNKSFSYTFPQVDPAPAQRAR